MTDKLREELALALCWRQPPKCDKSCNLCGDAADAVLPIVTRARAEAFEEAAKVAEKTPLWLDIQNPRDPGAR